MEMTGLGPANPLLAEQVLSQLSYIPTDTCIMRARPAKDVFPGRGRYSAPMCLSYSLRTASLSPDSITAISSPLRTRTPFLTSSRKKSRPL